LCQNVFWPFYFQYFGKLLFSCNLLTWIWKLVLETRRTCNDFVW
jgi:hypothetical protein